MFFTKRLAVRIREEELIKIDEVLKHTTKLTEITSISQYIRAALLRQLAQDIDKHKLQVAIDVRLQQESINKRRNRKIRRHYKSSK